MMETFSEVECEGTYLAGGFANPTLAEDIAGFLGTRLGPLEQRIHPNGEIYSRFSESVRGKKVFIIQPHIGTNGYSVNDALMQQCLLADAARSSSAQEITAVSPYIAYSRQDRKSRGREPIGTRVVIDHLADSGVERIVAVDMHSPQTQAIFRGPFDHLTAQPRLREAMVAELNGTDKASWVVVAPDAGAAKLANRHSRELGVSLLHMAKMRDPEDSQRIRREEYVPEAEGRVCLVFDDMVDTAGTLTSAAEALANSGASNVYMAATHAIFSGPALERLKDAPIEKFIVTDTFQTDQAQEELGEKLCVTSVAPDIGKAIMEIVRNGSVSSIFNEQNYL